MPTKSKSTFTDDMVALATKAGGMNADGATDKLRATVIAAGSSVNATQPNAAIAALHKSRTAKSTEKTFAIIDILGDIVSAGDSRKVDVDPDIHTAYVVASLHVVADRLLIDGSDNLADMVTVLLDQSPKSRNQTFTDLIGRTSSQVAEKMLSRGRNTIHGRDLSRVADGEKFTWKGGSFTVKGGQIMVGGKKFSAPSPAARFAAKTTSACDGWRDPKASDGRTLHQHATTDS